MLPPLKHATASIVSVRPQNNSGTPLFFVRWGYQSAAHREVYINAIQTTSNEHSSSRKTIFQKSRKIAARRAFFGRSILWRAVRCVVMERSPHESDTTLAAPV